MKLVLQIAAGILLASLVSWCAFLLWTRWALYDFSQASQAAVRDDARRATSQVLKGVHAAATSSGAYSALEGVAQAYVGESMRGTLEKQAQLKAALRLKPGEECLGAFNGQFGTVVIRSVANGVPQRIQLLEHGRPVKCVGDYRVE